MIICITLQMDIQSLKIRFKVPTNDYPRYGPYGWIILHWWGNPIINHSFVATLKSKTVELAVEKPHITIHSKRHRTSFANFCNVSYLILPFRVIIYVSFTVALMHNIEQLPLGAFKLWMSSFFKLNLQLKNEQLFRSKISSNFQNWSTNVCNGFDKRLYL